MELQNGNYSDILGYYIKYQSEFDKSSNYKNEFEKSGLTIIYKKKFINIDYKN